MFPTIPEGFFETLFILAAIGIISTIGGFCYGLYWIIMHVRFV